MRRSAPIMDNPPPHIQNNIIAQFQRDLNHFLVSLERSIATASASNATQQNSKSTWISSRTHSDEHKNHNN